MRCTIARWKSSARVVPVAQEGRHRPRGVEQRNHCAARISPFRPGCGAFAGSQLGRVPIGLVDALRGAVCETAGTRLRAVVSRRWVHGARGVASTSRRLPLPPRLPRRRSPTAVVRCHRRWRSPARPAWAPAGQWMWLAWWLACRSGWRSACRVDWWPWWWSVWPASRPACTARSTHPPSENRDVLISTNTSASARPPPLGPRRRPRRGPGNPPTRPPWRRALRGKRSGSSGWPTTHPALKPPGQDRSLPTRPRPRSKRGGWTRGRPHRFQGRPDGIGPA
jgi:hypothetical protein